MLGLTLLFTELQASVVSWVMIRKGKQARKGKEEEEEEWEEQEGGGHHKNSNNK